MVTRRRANSPRDVSLVQRAKAYDDNRDGFFGEHWLVLGAGLAVWALSRKSPSLVVRSVGMVASTALVGRAASGRDGIAKLLRWTPVGRRIR